jgi:hypothetical protein
LTNSRIGSVAIGKIAFDVHFEKDPTPNQIEVGSYNDNLLELGFPIPTWAETAPLLQKSLLLRPAEKLSYIKLLVGFLVPNSLRLQSLNEKLGSDRKRDPWEIIVPNEKPKRDAFQGI